MKNSKFFVALLVLSFVTICYGGGWIQTHIVFHDASNARFDFEYTVEDPVGPPTGVMFETEGTLVPTNGIQYASVLTDELIFAPSEAGVTVWIYHNDELVTYLFDVVFIYEGQTTTHRMDLYANDDGNVNYHTRTGLDSKTWADIKVSI